MVTSGHTPIWNKKTERERERERDDYVHWNALLPIAMHQAGTIAHEQETKQPNG